MGVKVDDNGCLLLRALWLLAGRVGLMGNPPAWVASVVLVVWVAGWSTEMGSAKVTTLIRRGSRMVR